MKTLFILLLCITFPAMALVAPEVYKADPNCPKNAPFSGPRGKCISCNATAALMLENPEECDLCPNRMIRVRENWILSSNYCRLKKCPADKPFYEENWNWSGCKSCADKPVHITKEECAQCPNMRWVKDANYCAPDLPGRVYHKNGNVKIWQNGEITDSPPVVGGSAPWSTSCKKLTSSYGMAISPEECSHCKNTYMKDGFCFGKK